MVELLGYCLLLTISFFNFVSCLFLVIFMFGINLMEFIFGILNVNFMVLMFLIWDKIEGFFLIIFFVGSELICCLIFLILLLV